MKVTFLVLLQIFSLLSLGQYANGFLLQPNAMHHTHIREGGNIGKAGQQQRGKAARKLNMFSPTDITDLYTNLDTTNLDVTSSLTGISHFLTSAVDDATAEGGEVTYSKYSYYTTLGLYLLSFPGLISLVTRSVKAKNIAKTYEIAGPKAKDGDAKQTKLVAGEIMAYFKANNYDIGAPEGEEIIFKGTIGQSKSQAFFLSFCTFMGLASLALVLSIQFQDIGQKWFYMTLLSPYAGFYYWNRAAREDEARVKLEVSDNEERIDVSVIATKEEQERFSSALKYNEKGMIRVKGIFESDSTPTIN
jgi:hypothetical protein